MKKHILPMLILVCSMLLVAGSAYLAGRVDALDIHDVIERSPIIPMIEV